MQRTNSGLRATKIDSNTEGCAKGTQNPNTQRTDFGLRIVETNGMPRVVPGKNRGLNIQLTATPMVAPKIALAHSRQTSI